MITLEADRLVFRFPEIHNEATCTVSFQRTLRIPDDGRTYPLPPGLGRFPLLHIDDHAARLPESWLARGGVIMPMHQAEAMWLSFEGRYPFAIKVATGKINALTGENWQPHLNRDPQDYVVVPGQPWLDGYCVEKGRIRQFVAMPLGEGYSAEEQISGSAEHGGLQIIAYPMKLERFEVLRRKRYQELEERAVCYSLMEDAGMGLAPGGLMKQEIYHDEHGLDAWDQRHTSRCFVTIANTVDWMAITGQVPPTEPPSAAAYTRAGLPWFDYYGGDAEAIAGSKLLSGLSSVVVTGSKSHAPLPENESVAVHRIVPLGRRHTGRVREMPLR